MDYLKLPIGPQAPKRVNAVVEIPAGSANKYEYDKTLNLFRLDRPLFSSVHYPGDYGFVPSTVGDDGDALDILILAPHPAFTGCVVEVRPIGFLGVLDRGIADAKILAVTVGSPVHTRVRNHDDLAPHVLREIEHFFSIYKELEGKQTEVVGWESARQARDVIRRAHDQFRRRKSDGLSRTSRSAAS